MHSIVVYIALYFAHIRHSNARVAIENYQQQRETLLKEEELMSVGGQITLSKDEAEASDILMMLKRAELEGAIHNTGQFNLSKHYYAYKDHIETSKVYQVIKKMPKGAVLHIHSNEMLDPEGIVQLTYEDHLYACYTDNLKLQFALTAPKGPCPVKWTLLNDLRNASGDVALFDHDLQKHFTLMKGKHSNYDVNAVWRSFNKVYKTMKPLLAYTPVRRKYFINVLEKFYNDNIIYIEIRSGLHSTFDLDGTWTALPELYWNITQKFKETHPDFIGIKFIVTTSRRSSLNKVRLALEKVRKLKEKVPDLIAGFDLVGQEDVGRPLKDFLPLLSKTSSDIDFYFHGGETNWYGTPSDENLFDAMLMGSKRIGHGFALSKHPSLLGSISQMDIAIEVNVISNAVLALVSDVRNHPLATYLAMGLPVVLSSDDPAMWGAAPLSHDFYVAFMAVASWNSDLRLLKQLALNSIKYSAMSVNKKTKAYEVFDRRWNKFIEDVIYVKIKK